MPSIPLQKYRDFEFPLTPNSTMNLWAKQAYYNNTGPLKGRVEKVGGRWYVEIGSNDPVVEGILENIKNMNNQRN